MANKKRAFDGSRLKLYMGRINAKTKEALASAAKSIEHEAKSRCPVRTGHLRDSIHTEANNDGTFIKIIAGAEYAAIVEYSPKINKPFLYPAYDAVSKHIAESMRMAIKEACK